MVKMWADCLIAGMKSWESVKASRRDEVKAELERRVAAGELRQDELDRILGIEPEQAGE